MKGSIWAGPTGGDGQVLRLWAALGGSTGLRRWRGLVGCLAAVACAALAGCAGQQEQALWAEEAQVSGAQGAVSPPAGLVGGSPSRPAIELNEQSRLPDYLAYAALHNRALEAGFQRWKAAVERIPQVRALPDPQFTYRYFIVPQGMRDGDMRNVFEVTQMFPWLEKLALAGDLAGQEAKAEFQRFQAARWKLFNQVQQAYYEYEYLARAIATTEENVRLLEYLLSVAEARYQAAVASHPDVVRLQVEVGKLRNDLRTLEEMRGPTAAQLNAAMNRRPDAPLPSPSPAPAPVELSPLVVSEGELLVWLEESSPQLKGMDVDVVRQKRSIELAKKDYLPDLMLGVEFDQMRRAPGMPDMEMKHPLALMFTVSVPIWWDKYAAGVREARARHASALAERQEMANSLAAEVKMVTYRLRDAQRRLRLYGQTLLPKAREAFKTTEAAYRAGAASFSDLIDTQRTLLEFQLQHHRAAADRAQRLAELEMLLGRQVPRPPTAAPAKAPTTLPAAGATKPG